MNSEKISTTSFIEQNEAKVEQSRIPAKRIGSEALKATYAPEGYVSVSDFAESLGTNRGVVNRYFKENSIQLESFRTENGKNAKYLSPDLCEDFIENNGYRQPPEEYISVSDAAEILGVGKNTIRAYFKNDLDKYKGPNDYRPMQYLSPEQLEEYKQETVLDAAPDGYSTIDEFAVKCKVGVDVVRRFFQDDKESRMFRGSNGLPTQYLSPEDQQLFIDKYEELISKNQSLEKAPEGYLTIPEFAKQLRIDRDTIDRFFEDINLDEYKGHNFIAKYLSPKDQELFIKRREDLLSLEEAPDDYLTINDFAKLTGTSRAKIQSFLDEQPFDEHSITPGYFKGKNKKPVLFLPPLWQKRFMEEKKDLLSLKNPPEGFLSINEFASLYNVHRKTVENYITDDLLLYLNNNGSPAMYLSPEQQSVVLENMENMKSGTSIPENTVAYYFEKAGLSFEQGTRPDWLKNPDSGRNLEIDIFVDPPGIGIEYDGMRWHQDIERDIRKDNVAQKSGYSIVHIREDGCPEMPEGSVCINRKNNADDTDLGECIKKCFETIGIPVPDINVARDKKDIMAFMRQRVLDKLDSARTFEELSVVS